MLVQSVSPTNVNQTQLLIQIPDSPNQLQFVKRVLLALSLSSPFCKRFFIKQVFILLFEINKSFDYKNNLELQFFEVITFLKPKTVPIRLHFVRNAGLFPFKEDEEFRETNEMISNPNFLL